MDAGISDGSHPGVVVLSATAQWHAESGASLKERLEDVLIKDDDGNGFSAGPLLPANTDGRLVDLDIQLVRDHEHIALTLRPKPKSAPPEEVSRQDARVGGQEGLWTRLTDAWKPSGHPVAFHVVTMNVDAKSWSCPDVPSPVEGASELATRIRRLGSGGEVRLEQVGYRLTTGAAGMAELQVIYLHEREQYRVIIMGSAPVDRRDGRWLPYADTLRDTVMATLFHRRGDGNVDGG